VKLLAIQSPWAKVLPATAVYQPTSCKAHSQHCTGSHGSLLLWTHCTFLLVLSAFMFVVASCMACQHHALITDDNHGTDCAGDLFKEFLAPAAAERSQACMPLLLLLLLPACCCDSAGLSSASWEILHQASNQIYQSMFCSPWPPQHAQSKPRCQHMCSITATHLQIRHRQVHPRQHVLADRSAAAPQLQEAPRLVDCLQESVR
jgi:hypothetical protein